jgi:hypothetical protein
MAVFHPAESTDSVVWSGGLPKACDVAVTSFGNRSNRNRWVGLGHATIPCSTNSTETRRNRPSGDHIAPGLREGTPLALSGVSFGDCRASGHHAAEVAHPEPPPGPSTRGPLRLTQ